MVAPSVARTSAPIILTMENRHVPVLYEEGFQPPVSWQCGELIEIEHNIFVVPTKNIAQGGLINIR